MKIIKPVNNRPFLIVFVHGLIGGEETWVRKDGKKSIMEYLADDPQIRKHFDFALFTYDTTLFNKVLWLKYALSFITGKARRFTRNLSIRKLADLFLDELQINAKDYERIVIIAHSMGGLISKKLILDELERCKATNTNPKVGLYISLATPHAGAELASFGKLLLSSEQIENLAPTNEELLEMNNAWVQSQSLPKRIYVHGYNDQVVPEGGGGIDAQQNFPISSNDDHFSILVPNPGTSHVLNGIKDECMLFLQANGLAEEKSDHIEVLPLADIPPKKPIRSYAIGAILVILAGFIGWKVVGGSPEEKIIKMSGLTAYYLDPLNDTSYYITDYNDTSILNKLSNPRFSDFISRYVGVLRPIKSDSLLKYSYTESRNTTVKFDLPDSKSRWKGFVIAIDTAYYNYAESIDIDNVGQWAKFPEDPEGKIRFVYMDTFNLTPPSFIFSK
ncbi:MAG: hypothetical protein ABIQ11_05630 [Saprospiraceae bacterium]